MEDEGNRSCSDTTCSLSLEYSSSSFEWSDYGDGASTEADDVTVNGVAWLWNHTSTNQKRVNLSLRRKILRVKTTNGG